MKRSLGILAAFVLLLAGCGKQNGGEVFNLYYISASGEELEKSTFVLESTDVVSRINEVTAALSEPRNYPAGSTLLLPEGVGIRSTELNGSYVYLDLDSALTSLTPEQQLLIRAGLTFTYTQISGVYGVSISAGGEELKDSDGRPYGVLRSGSFIQLSSVNINNYQQTDMKLYFLNNAGNALIEENRTVYYSINIPKEQAVINELIKGPDISGSLSPFPADLTVLGVTMSDGVCYVNFDRNVNNMVSDSNPLLQIYSIVNSLHAVCQAELVSFTIDGSHDIPFRGAVDINQPFSPDLSYMEE
ncbi:MAG: GerMN domain-containing protein [Lachnospiraceae bacterium]|nr:GerMN domain-containing protein [Lachnospiraceae bacterium]